MCVCVLARMRVIDLMLPCTGTLFATFYFEKSRFRFIEQCHQKVCYFFFFYYFYLLFLENSNFVSRFFTDRRCSLSVEYSVVTARLGLKKKKQQLAFREASDV